MMEEKMEDLHTFIPRHDYLVCVDSDGTVFDTMDLKHGQCFCPLYIEHFGLQSLADQAKEAWERINLHSASRGIQRFLGLLQTMDALADRLEEMQTGFYVPHLQGLRDYICAGYPLHHAGMELYLQKHPEAEDVRKALAWSRAVDERVAGEVHGVLPFPGAGDVLEKMQAKADVVVVSVTQRQALVREWGENGLLHTASLICGRESGSKKEIISILMGRYAKDHVLMIGDAPGDRDAALINGALFYPICAGEEKRSWADFGPCFDAFVHGTYRSEMQDERIAYFDALLPPVSLCQEKRKP